MKIKIAYLLPLLFAGLFPLQASAFRDVPALIHLNSQEQRDTIGFNLVENMCRLLYPEIVKGSIHLYNGPEKTLKISGEALQSLEKSTGTSFLTCPDLFVYEYWSSNKKTSEFRLVGFSFINKNLLGEKISYGYVDYNEIQAFLQNNLLPNNANGYAELNYDNAWKSRRYYYHLIQLGQEAFFANPSQAVKLKQEIFGGKKNIINQVILVPEKKVSYFVLAKKYTTDIDLSNELVNSIQKALALNPEVYLNIGGSGLVKFPDTCIRIPRISALYIEEFWVKDGRNSRIRTARIKCLVEDIELDWIYLEDLEKMGVFIRFHSLAETLYMKPFEFEIQSVNDQEINSLQGPIYLEAIKRYNWSRINEYIHP